MSQVYRRAVDTWLKRNNFNASTEQRCKLVSLLQHIDSERSQRYEDHIDTFELEDILFDAYKEIMTPYIIASNNASSHRLT